MPAEVIPPKISLYKYATGQLDIRAVRTAMGLPPDQPNRKRPSPALIRAAQFFAPPPVVKATMAKAQRAIDAANANANADAAHPKDEKGQKATQGTTTATFTAAEDARILEWKAANEGKPWRTLAEEMGGKPEAALKARFKQLKGAADPKGPSKDKAGKGAANTGRKRESENKPKLDSKEEAVMRALLTQDDDDRWLRLASRYFDKTGRDIHPDDLKSIYGGGGGSK